jgi:hypothetical protein
MNELKELINDLFIDGLDVSGITQFLMNDPDFAGVEDSSIFFYVEDTLNTLREEWEADMAGF